MSLPLAITLMILLFDIGFLIGVVYAVLKQEKRLFQGKK